MMIAKINLIGGRFYFKVDRKSDNLVLFFASNIHIKSENKANHQACLGEKYEVSIKAFKRKP